MSVCENEEQEVNQLRALIAAMADVTPDETPSERADAKLKLAQLEHQLASAQSALDNCRRVHTWYEVRLHVVRMANDDGSNPTAVTLANAEEWIRVANLVFAPARLRVLLDPATDFETRNNTRLNQLVEGTGLKDDDDAINDANGIGDQFPNRIAVICRTSRPLSAPPFGNCGPGCGFSGFPGKYVIMPAFDPNLAWLFAHELGHYLGLPHTFRFVIDTTRDAGIVFDILGDSLQALENDASVVNDTPPEMIINDQSAGPNTSVSFGGQTISFLRNNVMSYYRPLTLNGKTITQGQAARVMAVLQQRRSAGLDVAVLVGLCSDHFYTTSVAERDNAVTNVGYTNEGIACYVFDLQAPGTKPLFRLRNSNNGDHFYTTSVAEHDNAMNNLGYTDEGTACYVFDSQVAGTTPLYRLLNSCDHFYTTSKDEHDNAVANKGTDEGIACYVFDSQAPGTVPLYRLFRAA